MSRVLTPAEMRGVRLDLIGRRLQMALALNPKSQDRHDWLSRNIRRWRRLILNRAPFKQHPDEQ